MHGVSNVLIAALAISFQPQFPPIYVKTLFFTLHAFSIVLILSVIILPALRKGHRKLMVDIFLFLRKLTFLDCTALPIRSSLVSNNICARRSHKNIRSA